MGREQSPENRAALLLLVHDQFPWWRIFKFLPFEDFTSITVVEDKKLGISVLEKDLQGNVL